MFNFNPRFPRGKRHRLASEPVSVNRNFNPRFPRGKRPGMRVGEMLQLLFQSTLPAGEATVEVMKDLDALTISIHASRGGSDSSADIDAPMTNNFNPRFPRGKRPSYPSGFCFVILFQSTLPAGEATLAYEFIKTESNISIHASRGGSDSTVKLSPDDRTKQYGFREP